MGMMTGAGECWNDDCECCPSQARQYTEQEVRDSYEGRKACDREEMREGYCGSCPFSTHVNQMLDPSSWVHSSVERWLNKANPNRTPRDIFRDGPSLELNAEWDRIDKLVAEFWDFEHDETRFEFLKAHPELHDHVTCHECGQIDPGRRE